MFFAAFNFCFILFYLMFSNGDMYIKSVVADSILARLFMLVDCLCSFLSSLTYINSPTLPCYTVQNTLGVDGLCWGLDLQFGRQCLKVRVVLKTVVVFISLIALSMLSLSSRMHGKQRVSFLSSSSASFTCSWFVEELLAIGYKHVAMVLLPFGYVVSLA